MVHHESVSGVSYTQREIRSSPGGDILSDPVDGISSTADDNDADHDGDGSGLLIGSRCLMRENQESVPCFAERFLARACAGRLTSS
jgi:hypothetical protein